MYQNVINIEPVLAVLFESKARGEIPIDIKPIGKGIRWTSSGMLIKSLDDGDDNLFSGSLISSEATHQKYGT